MKSLSFLPCSPRAIIAVVLTLILLTASAPAGLAETGAKTLPVRRSGEGLRLGGNGAASPNKYLPRRSLSPAAVPASIATASANLYAYAFPSLYFVPSGGTVSFTVYVGNGGPDVAEDAYVTGLFPASFSVGAITNNHGSCGTTSNSDGSTSLHCMLGDIYPYEMKTVTVTASPAGTSYALLSAGFEAGSATPDANLYNNAATAALRIAAPPLPTPTPAAGVNPLVAFVDGSADIHAVGADGTGLVNLTDNPVDEEVYEWSPDGARLAFVRYDAQTGEDNIFVMDADGTDQTQLTGVAGDHFYDPAWSPDGTKIAFSHYVDADGENVIGVMEADGTAQVTLTGGANAYDYAPRWSPDGTRIAFSRYDLNTGAENIYVMDADGTDLLNLTGGTSYNFAPEWSPDGARIAFISYRDGNAEIYLMNSDGTQQSNLTQSLGWDYSPRWSPDGTKIAFYSYRSGGAGISVVGADGSGLVSIGDDIEQNGQPGWSPDGTRLVFTTARNGVGAINLVNPDGSGRVKLITCQYSCGSPRWQPVPPPD
jgi:TolB protein